MTANEAGANTAPAPAPRPLPGVPDRPRPGLLEGVLVSLTAAVQLLPLIAFVNPRTVFPTNYLSSDVFPGVILMLFMAAAVLYARSAPHVALLLVWTGCAGQVLAGVTAQPSQIAILWVAFCTARYGSRAVVVASGVSAVAGTAIAGFYAVLVLENDPYAYLTFYGAIRRMLLRTADIGGPASILLMLLLATVPLIMPWLLGIVARLIASSRDSETARMAAVEQRKAAEQLRELAERDRANALRLAAIEAHQARLARDVHDIVGHSLAVILAQAQAGQYVTGDEALRETLSNIASSARRSLGEVRQVLGELRDGTPQEPPVDGIAALLDSLRVAGVEVRESVTGAPRPLPPEVEAVVYRVMQEMVTNVLKHGRPGGAVSVEQVWSEGLRLQVRNYVGPATGDGRGSGIAGMRGRLESVGGSLEMLRYDDDEGEIVSATAWIPFRWGAGA